MISKTNKSMPKPCKENWLEMTPAEKARFCKLCQQNIFDFKNDSEVETQEECIKNQHHCERYNFDSNADSQLKKSKAQLFFNQFISFISKRK